jgi:hypothetical protein
VCFDFLYNFCLEHFSLWQEFSEILLKMYIGLHVKYPLFLSDCNETWILSTDLRKNTQISNLIKIHPVGAELFHADRQTDRQVNNRFSQFFERVWKLIPSTRCSPQPTVWAPLQCIWQYCEPVPVRDIWHCFLSVNGSVWWHCASVQCQLTYRAT